jgi:hypothetical protein
LRKQMAIVGMGFSVISFLGGLLVARLLPTVLES